MRKRILFATTEVTPLVGNANIADFNGLLPKELSDEYETAIIMPFYPSISPKSVCAENTNITFTISISDSLKTVTIWKGKLPDTNVTLFLLANSLFDRAGIYGNHTGPYPDNSIRFTLFSRAVLHFVDEHYAVDTIVASDWYTALIPVFLKEQYQKFNKLRTLKTIMTIFDLTAQGRFWVYDLHILNLGWDIFTPDKLEFYNDLNFLKGGIVYADTVYFPSQHTLNFLENSALCHGLQGVLQFHRKKLRSFPANKEEKFLGKTNMLTILSEN